MNWQTIGGWFDVTDAKCYEMIVENTRDKGVIVEIGCLLGRSACCLLEIIKKAGKHISPNFVDSFVNIPEHPDTRDLGPGAIKNACVKNIVSTGYLPFFFWTDSSVNVAQHFKDDAIDAVFIDGAHDYDSVVADIKAWLPKVRKGGIIAGHDFNFPEVTKAVYDTISTPIEEIGFCWLARL